MALAIALVMCMAMGVPAMAEDITGGDGFSITIDNAVNGETYTAYKIFDETQAASGSTTTAYTAVAGSEANKEANRFVTYYTRSGSEGSYTYATVSDNSTIEDSATVYEAVLTPAAYTISTSNPWYSVVNTYAETTSNGLTLTQSAGDSSVYVVTVNNSFSAANFAQTLKNTLDNASTSTTPTAAQLAAVIAARATVSGTANGTSTTSTTLNVGTSGTETYRGAGYYFVDTSAGALCALNTSNTSVTIKEKNTIPSETKEVYNTTPTAAWGSSDDAQIGDTVKFKITVTDGVGTDTAITVYDAMSDGLTLNASSIAVYKLNTADFDSSTTYYTLTDDAFVAATGLSAFASETDYYTLVNSGASTYTATTSGLSAVTDSTGTSVTPDFSVAFAADYVNSLGTGDKVVIYYTATVNDSAVIAGNANTNDSFLTYGNQTTVTQETTVYTYEFDLVKDNGANSELLAGAVFNLYRADQIGLNGKLKTDPAATPITFIKSADGKTYRVKTSDYEPQTGETSTNDLTSLATDKLNIEGLDVDDYYLVETTAPAGYNALTTPVKITVSQATSTSGGTTTVTGTNVLPVNGTESSGTITYTAASGATAGTGVATITGDTTKTYSEGGVEVQNNAGSVLPSTGGIGTTIFYVIGAVLAIGAGVLLVTHRRMRAE